MISQTVNLLCKRFLSAGVAHSASCSTSHNFSYVWCSSTRGFVEKHSDAKELDRGFNRFFFSLNFFNRETLTQSNRLLCRLMNLRLSSGDRSRMPIVISWLLLRSRISSLLSWSRLTSVKWVRLLYLGVSLNYLNKKNIDCWSLVISEIDKRNFGHMRKCISFNCLNLIPGHIKTSQAWQTNECIGRYRFHFVSC